MRSSPPLQRVIRTILSPTNIYIFFGVILISGSGSVLYRVFEESNEPEIHSYIQLLSNCPSSDFAGSNQVVINGDGSVDIEAKISPQPSGKDCRDFTFSLAPDFDVARIYTVSGSDELNLGYDVKSN